MAEGYKYIGKAQIRKWLKESLKDLCRQYNFKLGTVQGCPTTFYCGTSSYSAYMHFFINTGDLVSTSDCFLRLNAIEEKLAEILGPSRYHTIILQGIESPWEQIFSRIEVDKLVYSFTNNFKTKCLPFIEKYSNSLLETLSLWDSLDASGRANTFYDPNMHAKMLIASKMVNDKKFDERIEKSIAYFDQRIESGKKIFIERKENFLKVKQALIEPDFT